MATRPLAIPSFHVTQKRVSTPGAPCGARKVSAKSGSLAAVACPAASEATTCISPLRIASQSASRSASLRREGTSWRGCRAALAVVQRQIMGQVSAKSVGTVPHFLNSLMASRDSLQVTCGR